MVGIDRLSDLHDNILHQILFFVDTQSSVRTSILSRRWRSVWKHVTVLNFDRSSFKSRRVFNRLVERVLSLHYDRVSITRVTMDNWGVEKKKNLFDRLMKYPSCYQSLKALELQRTLIEQPDVKLLSRFQLLESLTLISCCITADDDPFANFPRLETLKLVDPGRMSCSQTGFLKVTGPKLLNLEIVSPIFEGLQINAPKLQSFSLKIFLSHCAQVSKDSDVPSLNRANITLFGYTHSTLFGGIDAKRQLDNLFDILQNVQALNLEVRPFELLIETCNSVKCKPPRFKRMKALNLRCLKGASSDVPDEVIRYFLGAGYRNEEEKRFTVEKLQ